MENYNRVEKNRYGTFYFLNKKLHRIGGTAVEYLTGGKMWYQNGKRHRIDGPAVKHSNGNKFWYYGDELINCKSQKDFERYIKLKLFW